MYSILKVKLFIIKVIGVWGRDHSHPHGKGVLISKCIVLESLYIPFALGWLRAEVVSSPLRNLI